MAKARFRPGNALPALRSTALPAAMLLLVALMVVPIPAFLKGMLAAGAILMLLQTLSHLWHKTPQKPEGPETVI